MPQPSAIPEEQAAPNYHELHIALDRSLKLQRHYASLLNMHDGGERVGFETVDAWIARLRETKALPARPSVDERKDALFREFEQENPDRAKAMLAEINEVMRGNFREIEFQLDPLTAYHLAGSLDLALAHPEHSQSTREGLDAIYAGIVERIEPQCPELARQLRDGRRKRQEEKGRDAE